MHQVPWDVPRKKGKRLPTLEKVAEHKRTRWKAASPSRNGMG